MVVGTLRQNVALAKDVGLPVSAHFRSPKAQPSGTPRPQRPRKLSPPSREKLAAHLRVDRYGDFLLTDAIRPAPSLPVVPRQGYRRDPCRYLASAFAQRQANADFAPPLKHRIVKHAIQANAGEQ